MDILRYLLWNLIRRSPQSAFHLNFKPDFVVFDLEMTLLQSINKSCFWPFSLDIWTNWPRLLETWVTICKKEMSVLLLVTQSNLADSTWLCMGMVAGKGLTVKHLLTECADFMMWYTHFTKCPLYRTFLRLSRQMSMSLKAAVLYMLLWRTLKSFEALTMFSQWRWPHHLTTPRKTTTWYCTLHRPIHFKHCLMLLIYRKFKQN